MKYLLSIDSFPQQLKEALVLSREIRLMQIPRTIVFCGDGRSGIVGDIMLNLGCLVPIVVNKSEELPVWVNQDTLVFCICYSGNAGEVLQCAHGAHKKHAKLVILTSGGKLLSFAQEQGITCFQLPSNCHWSLGFFLIPMIVVLMKNNLIQVTYDDIEKSVSMLVQVNLKDKASEIAQNIGNKTPLICTNQQLSGAALHIKESMNRIAKVPAHVNVFPAMTYTEQGVRHTKSYAILLRDEAESKTVQECINNYKRGAKEHKLPYTEVMIRGTRQLNKILLAIMMGEYIAYFLAQIGGVEAPEELLK